MTRTYISGLSSLEWSAISAANRHIQDTARSISTSAFGSLDRHMREAMALARPIETDLGIARAIGAQLAAYRDVTKLQPWADSLRLNMDSALQLAGTDRVLTALTSPTSAATKLHGEVATQLATLREHTAALDAARRFATDATQEIESTLEALGKQLAEPFVHIDESIQKYLADTVGALDFQAAMADAVNVHSLLRTARHAVAQLHRLHTEATASADDGYPPSEGQIVDIAAIRSVLSEVGLETGGTIDLKTLQRAVQEAVRQGMKTPAKVAVLHWLFNLVQQVLIAVLVAYAFAPDGPRNQPPRVIQRQVSLAARQLSADPATLKHLRIVLKPSLPAFRHRARKSGSVGTLRLGEVVIVLERRRNWTRIKWNEDGMTQGGWVSTRYLGRIQPDRVQPQRHTLPPRWTCD